ncbi:uncharacterized protein ACA1_391180 [Acanthamoeba castellanii str. Neff]|uniref:Glycerol kinase n=1 Tax=Acanthamoeba castellanii (strain ATCC 30010 / Neff) TaxID=1257118 RepID=L8GP56_ACACF|nr:uncharacterized protein ACA1_391180 [Acanthamoeba castellanii str. Neff]ELR14760.1 hypothetical protein ACA1_391180 [Acanthamoeba castellanii str. Neff]
MAPCGDPPRSTVAPSQQERRIQALKAEQERLEEEIEKLKYDLEHERDEDITHAQPTEKPAGRLVLGLDVGTTGAKAFIYDERANCIADSYKELTPIRDEPGQEEQCPQNRFSAERPTLWCRGDICAMGVTTQRNTLILWDKETGEPLCNFVTWQDTRTAKYCRQLNDALACRGIRSAATVAYRMTHKVKYALAKNYHFQPTHITPRLAWMLQRLPNDKKQYIKQGRLLFGLVDSYLIWKFTGGAVHATDYSNISSTGLWDVFVMNWNTTITNMCRIPLSIMPEIRPSSGDFGETVPEIFGASIPIRANCADQGAALFGDAASPLAMPRSPPALGASSTSTLALVPIGSPDGLYPFVAWTIGDKTTFMMEGLASTIGTVVNWSRNHLGIFDEEEETSAIASSVPSTEGVYFVPAFSGLGAPQSDGGARGVIVGLSATTTKSPYRARHARGHRLQYQRLDGAGGGGGHSARAAREDQRRPRAERLPLPVPGRHPRQAAQPAPQPLACDGGGHCLPGRAGGGRVERNGRAGGAAQERVRLHALHGSRHPNGHDPRLEMRHHQQGLNWPTDRCHRASSAR